MTFFADQTFDRNFSFSKGEYDNCIFENCDFTGKDLGDSIFTECTFTECNFSMVKLAETGLRDVTFANCKLLGFRFDQCDAFGFAAVFENCQMDLSSFYRMKIRKQKFKNCAMRDVDFSECDLTQATFDNCDLQDAIFDNTILEKADLRSAIHYTIDASSNYLKGARISLASASGLLSPFGIIVE